MSTAESNPRICLVPLTAEGIEKRSGRSRDCYPEHKCPELQEYK